ncbi:MAG TPA: universal stress protein [Thermodesulfovibrionales bacterium]|nr:universal stress protein [Thermodesulfovibrionales bacterium]
MDTLKRKIEEMLSAISFAEEGEFETARQFLKEDRRVLLAVRKDQADRRTFRYAINTCKRINAALDILYISPSKEQDPALQLCLSELTHEGINYRLVQKGGCLKQAVIDYANTIKGILFAVTESSDKLDVDCKGMNTSKAWKDLKCPLVVVEENV